MTADKDFFVAIELGSSKIAGIAGKKKDGSMQILAYAEEKTTACVKRGVVYNIEKTYQSINNIISKLESVLKTKINRAYVGLGGQSMRSHKTLIKRNMLTQSYITNEAIDGIREESHSIPFSDYEVLENFPQEYIVDSNIIADPVGVMGTNIEGEFLNVIAKQNMRTNIDTCFANTHVDIAEELISPLQLANNVLTDSEKRSGCVLVDLGADTTSVVVYKNNIVRYLVTIPLGSNNINKDLATIQVDEAEAEELKLKFGDACVQELDAEELESNPTYTTSDGRQIEVALIRNIIEARMGEIIANVSQQIIKSNYSGKLLAGIILTGGGAGMKNIDKAFLRSSKLEKIRIAKTINQVVVKTSNAANFSLDNGCTNTILSLLLAATIPCGGEAYDSGNIFEKQLQDEERLRRQQQQEAAAEAERKLAVAFDEKKTAIRKECEAVKKMLDKLEKFGSDKNVRAEAQELSLSALDVLGSSYEERVASLEGREKFKQSLKEGAELADLLRDYSKQLAEKVNEANREHSFLGRLSRYVNDVLNND